jgi:hypothetical protein
MMTHGTPRITRIQLLLDILFHERFARCALVAELIEELAGAPGQAEAARAARVLLDRVNSGIADPEYKRKIARLMDLTRPEPEDPEEVASVERLSA